MKGFRSGTSKSDAEHSPISNPQRRATDHFHIGRIYPRENWYRDIWLLIITIVVVITVNESVNTSNKAETAIRDVQKERIATATRNCISQNDRHDATIRELKIIYKSPPPPLRLKGIDHHIADALNKLTILQQAKSLRPTILLIDALVPHQDCKKIASLILTQKVTK